MTKQVTRKYLWLRKAFKQLRSDLGDRCYFEQIKFISDKCSDNLEFAHVKPTELSGNGRGSYERYKDIIQNPTHYIILCKRHHQMFDSGELKL